MSKFLRLGLPGLAVALLAAPAWAKPAAPPSVCTSVSPGRDGVMPSAPALPLGLHRGSNGAGKDVNPRLIGPNGAPVPLSVVPDPFFAGTGHDVVLLKPASPLGPGSYLVRYADACIGIEGETRFAVVDSSPPLPATTGALAVTGKFLASECGPQEVSLRLDPSSELMPFKDMVVFRVEVDGAFQRFVWDASPYGWKGGTMGFSLPASCTDDGANLPGYVTLGKHRVTVRAHIAGREVDPTPVETMIELDCAGFDPRLCAVSPEYVRPDAGVRRRDAGAGEAPARSGCSLGGGGPMGGVSLLVAGLLVAGRSWRRRDVSQGRPS